MVEAKQETRGIAAATLALAALAGLGAEFALADQGASPWLPPIRAAGLVAVAVAARFVVGRRAKLRGEVSSVAMAAILVATALPLALALGRAAATGRPGPMELPMLASMRNLGLGLAAIAVRPAIVRLAALLSLFQMVASSSAADGPWLVALIASYAVVGGAWLVLAHWGGLSLASGEASRRKSPAMSVAAAFGLIGLVVAVVAAGPTRAAVALAGLFPSSGGVDWDDPDARAGVNDGANEVKGSKKPESIGFSDSDAYLESDRPSLYDAFNDMYGEPIKPKRQEKMQALANQIVTEQKENPAENNRAGREFSAVRRRDETRASRRPSDREADALLYVEGPTPLHLGLTTYERFDGREWGESPHCNLHCPLALEDRAGPWFRLDHPSPLDGCRTVAHRMKVGKLDSSPLPVPAHLHAFRVGAIARADFFDWSCEAKLRMVGRTVPSSTVIETECRVPDLGRVQQLDFVPRQGAPAEADVGYSCSEGVSRLARRWTEGRVGWGRIEAIVAGLRAHAACDPSATAPAECPDVVEHFLLRSRRGPDYLFASAAVVMLREAGHRARLVTGLYARPDRYDRRTRHTPVSKDDVHTWAEVWCAGGAWMPIEPTPGYSLMAAPPSWLQSLLAFVGRVVERKAEAAVLAIVLLAAFAFRRELADAVATLAWLAASRGPERRVVVLTLGLMERRSRLGGMARPEGATLRRWYGPMGASSVDGSDLMRLVGLAEWGLYAPGEAGPPGGEDPRDACRRVVRGWTWKRFRASRTPIAKERP